MLLYDGGQLCGVLPDMSLELVSEGGAQVRQGIELHVVLHVGNA